MPIEGECDHACGPCPASPIVVDLGGDGFELTDLGEGVRFDLFPDGDRERVSWIAASSDDAWLVLDRNANGRVDDGRELFGTYTDQPAPGKDKMRNGYAALAAFDENGDTVISEADSIFPALRLWRDANHDGVSTPDELSTLSKHGILGLGTDYRVSRRIDRYGNLFRFSAMVYFAAGSTVGQRSFDVFLITESLERRAREHGLVSNTGAVMLALIAPKVKRGEAGAETCDSGCGIGLNDPPDTICKGGKPPRCQRCGQNYETGTLTCQSKWCRGDVHCRVETDAEGRIIRCEQTDCPPPCTVH